MRTGLDRLATNTKLAAELRAARVGLLAHPASVDRRMVHARTVLRELGVAVRIVFGPEHGYGGEMQDMVGVTDARDADGTPVRSLYGEAFSDLSPRRGDLEEIDLLVVDLQDVGARYYTFVWTAVLALRACRAAGVRVLVLDRPNPIGGGESTLEGSRQSEGYLSFVGLEPLAVRHGLTLGEVVAWRAEAEGLPAESLRVVGVSGLSREEHATGWGRPFVPPSPNMPRYETALVYPGGCLLEGTNLSEGRGTTLPFEIVGAPWIDGHALTADLHALGLGGFRSRPLTFRPTFHKHAGLACGGVQIHVTDVEAFRPYATYVGLVALAWRQDPDRFLFRTSRYEFRDDVPAFDLLTGQPAVRSAITRGESPLLIAERAANVDEADVDVHRQALDAIRRRAV